MFFDKYNIRVIVVLGKIRSYFNADFNSSVKFVFLVAKSHKRRFQKLV